MLSVDYNKNEPYILIADDDDDDSLFMTAAFKEVGLLGSIKRVTDGADLLTQLKDTVHKKEHLPSIIILDLNMPHMNGKDTLRAIKKDFELMHIPVIIYSTSSTKSDMLECYAAGCNGYIVKPNDYHEIERIAERIRLFFLDVTGNNSEDFSGMFSLNA